MNGLRLYIALGLICGGLASIHKGLLLVFLGLLFFAWWVSCVPETSDDD